jgi:GNAT superfamily N-acetyltransferase
LSYVEILAAHHDRQSFDCGKEPLNQFLREQAKQNADRHLGVTKVIVESPRAARVQGYFTLVTRTVEADQIPARKRKLPRGPVGIILLGRLAVDVEFHGRGLGRRILLRAMAEVQLASRSIGVHGLILDVIDDEAKAWYLGLDFGFKPFPEDTDRLFVPTAFLQQLDFGTLGPEL